MIMCFERSGPTTDFCLVGKVDHNAASASFGLFGHTASSFHPLHGQPEMGQIIKFTLPRPGYD